MLNHSARRLEVAHGRYRYSSLGGARVCIPGGPPIMDRCLSAASRQPHWPSALRLASLSASLPSLQTCVRHAVHEAFRRLADTFLKHK